MPRIDRGMIRGMSSCHSLNSVSTRGERTVLRPVTVAGAGGRSPKRSCLKLCSRRAHPPSCFSGMGFRVFDRPSHKKSQRTVDIMQKSVIKGTSGTKKTRLLTTEIVLTKAGG
jgi:hypothetical protein